VRELVRRVNARDVELNELREAIRKCVHGFEEFHNNPGVQWELMVDPIVEAAELIGMEPKLED